MSYSIGLVAVAVGWLIHTASPVSPVSPWTPLGLVPGVIGVGLVLAR